MASAAPRVAYVSHSLVAERQARFAAALRSRLEAAGGALVELYPVEWGRHRRPGGLPVLHPGDNMAWDLPASAWWELESWRPDVLMLQAEAYTAVAHSAWRWCRARGVPYVTFSWENALRSSPRAAVHLRDAAVNVYGNRDAQSLARGAGVGGRARLLPQVGVDPVLFAPGPARDAEWDVLFAGRGGDRMKGEHVLDGACEGRGWRVRKLSREPYAPYHEMPERFRSAAVQAVPSVDVPGLPREQFAPYATVESLMCGTPAVTSDQEAIVDWMEGCPAWASAPMGDFLALRGRLEAALGERAEDAMAWRARAAAGREWAVARFSNDAVAEAWLGVLREAAAR